MSEIPRRTLLSAGAASITVAAAGCMGLFEDEIEFDDDVPEDIADHLATSNNVDGSITDRTGEEELVIENGPDDDLAYDPALVKIDPGTTVTWVWESPGHTVTSSDGNFDVETSQESAGFDVSYTFEETGTYLYECEPHSAQGHRGAIVVE